MTQTPERTDRKIVFFDGKPVGDLSDLMSPEVFEDGVVEKFGARMSSLAGVFHPSVLFTGGPGGFSLAQLEAHPGAILPTHHHDVDCLYYVAEGEISLGSRILPKGAGFFVPADTRYAYKAGPDGAKVLEFRDSSRFDIIITETSEAKWDQLLTAAEVHRTTPAG